MNERDTTAREMRRTRVPIRHVAAILAGNALEFFDFISYAFFAVYIGKAFFPAADGSTSLLLSLATFGVGFLARPIGGLVIAPLGDRIGRKPTMILSFSLMGGASLGIALTPPYAAIGIAAPALVIVFRLLQGFAVGGEVGPTTSFLIESAPEKRRGLFASFFLATADFAVLVAGLIGVLLASTLDAEALQAWGWRVPFFIGAAIVPFGLALRRTLPETLIAHGEEATPHPARARAYLGLAAIAAMLFASTTVLTYMRHYMTTYAINTLMMPASLAFGATLTTGLVSIFSNPFGGHLSDRFGPRRMMALTGLLVLALAYPLFLVLTHLRTGEALVFVAAAMALLGGIFTPPAIAWFAGAVPKHMRSGIVGITYAFAVGIFGGTTQLAVTWLIGALEDPLAPAYYLMAAMALGLFAIALAGRVPKARSR